MRFNESLNKDISFEELTSEKRSAEQGRCGHVDGCPCSEKDISRGRKAGYDSSCAENGKMVRLTDV